MGARIRRLRLAAGLSQVQLAERVGLDHRTISRMENGVHSTNLDVLWLTAHGLRLDLWRFFRDD